MKIDGLINELSAEKWEQEKRNYSFLGIELEGMKERMQVEMLKMLNTSMYTMLDAAPVSFYWKDLEGRYLGCNDYMLQMNGLTGRDELIGKTDASCVWSSAFEQLRTLDQQVIQSGKAIQIEECAIILGETRTYLTRKAPLTDKNAKIIGVIGISIDITERKKAEREAEDAREREQKIQQEMLLAEARAVKLEKEKVAAEKQALDAREREVAAREQKIAAERRSEKEQTLRNTLATWSGALAHDLKNPLHSSGLAVEMAGFKLTAIQEKYNLPQQAIQEIYTYLETVTGNAETMTAIIDSATRRIQEIASDDPQPILEALPVEVLMQHALTNYQEDIDRGLIHCAMDDNAPLLADPIFFGQIITNLLDNAKRQIRLKGKGQIFIRAYAGGNHYLIDIKDTAGGLTQTDIDRLFTLYKTKEVHGTGIGLQSSQLLMQQMNGTLTAHLVDGDCIAMRLQFVR